MKMKFKFDIERDDFDKTYIMRQRDVKAVRRRETRR